MGSGVVCYRLDIVQGSQQITSDWQGLCLGRGFMGLESQDIGCQVSRHAGKTLLRPVWMRLSKALNQL